MSKKRKKADFESLCPKCGTLDYHWLREHVPGVFDIPPRDVLQCANDKCKQVFYRRAVNGN
jgi:hypothetical protein